jgi:hypothetical protein
MPAIILRQQIERIRLLQDEVQRVLLDDSLDQLEQCIAELGSRLASVISTALTGNESAQEPARTLEALLSRQRELEALVQRKLQVIGTELSKARASRAAARRYAVDPVQATARSKPSADFSV